MTESKMIDLSTVIGVYPVCNTGAVLIHAIDYEGDRVLASINGIDPAWCDLTEQYVEETQDAELGFSLGSLFVPFFRVERFFGGAD